MSIQLTFVVFDLLRADGEDMTGRPYVERRERLEALELHGSGWAISERFEDGLALYSAVCKLGFEGVVAKNHASLYRPEQRGWVNVKNPNYWRRDFEREAVARSWERRARTHV
jgi:bifunctional non-homologous end joining protein LigD